MAQDYYARLVSITPELATQWLENNPLNRDIRDEHVQRLAHDIVVGQWVVNGDTVKRTSTGMLLDGQHRLWAVIEAGKAADMFVIDGIPEDAFHTIDTGVAKRFVRPLFAKYPSASPPAYFSVSKTNMQSTASVSQTFHACQFDWQR